MKECMMPPPPSPTINPSAAVAAVPLHRHHDHDQAVGDVTGALEERRRSSSRSTNGDEDKNKNGSPPPRRTTTTNDDDDDNDDPSEELEGHDQDDEQQPQRQPRLQHFTIGGSDDDARGDNDDGDLGARHDTHPEKDQGRQEESTSSSTVRYTILAFYKFQRVQTSELEGLKDELVHLFRQHDAMGNVLLASEGINGTVCYPRHVKGRDDDDADDDDNIMVMDPIQQYLLHKFPNPMMRMSYCHTNVFWRLRVRIKSEVVTMGVPNLSLVGGSDGSGDGDVVVESEDDGPKYAEERDHRGGKDGSCHDCCPDMPGKYVSPREWNDVLRDPSTLVIDTRNTYEIEVGTFENAVNPHTTSFVEFPHWLENQLKGEKRSRRSEDAAAAAVTNPATNNITKLAFFCTGGVRCEKATAYAHRLLKEHQQSRRDGSESPVSPVPEVLHLKGGILAYLETVLPQDSMFHGECYVFDNRVAVSHGLQPTRRYVACKACRHPLSKDELEQDDYVEGRQCKYCVDDPDRQLRRDRYQMRHQNVVAAQQLGGQHLGSNSVDAARAKCRAEMKKSAALAAATTAGAGP